MLDRIAHDSITELRLARPPANALNADLLATLREAIAAEVEAGTEAIVLSGREGLFSAGLDVPELLTLDRDGIARLWRELFGVIRALASCPVPVAAAVTGHSPAGGAVLTLFCDWRVMAEGPPSETQFRIGLNEVQVGLTLSESIYGPLRRLVGRRSAEKLAVAGALLPAAEAHRLGWIDELAPVGEVVERAVGYLRGLLALPRTAMLSTRALLRADLMAMIDEDEGVEERVTELWFSDETQAAMKAMVARLADRKKDPSQKESS